ncbi:MAG: NUDIX hydrolase [Parcubacteria group bacterium]|jgi:8-oxo-dGTP pyrophosphatase MutT (NUDIX family)
MDKYTSIILFTTDGKLIFQQKDKGFKINNSGKITTFGGKIETGEKPLEAALREIEEELMIKLKEEDLDFFGNYKDKNYRDEETFVFAYMARNINPEKLKLKEGKSIFYFSKNENLENYNFSNLARRLVKDYLSKEYL